MTAIVRAFGLVHQRRLYLADNGDDLRGEDTLEGPAGRALRAPLPPASQRHLDAGRRWRQRAAEAAERRRLAPAGDRRRRGRSESIYLGGGFGDGDEPRRTNQVIVTGDTVSDSTVIKWALRRESKPPAQA